MSPDRKNKPTPGEVLAAIEEADDADEVDRILALSDEDLDRELQAGGLDPKAVRERGREIAERLTAASGDEPTAGGAWVSAPPPPVAPQPRWVWLADAALVAAAIGGGAIVAGSLHKHDEPVTPTDAALSPLDQARAIREAAFKACNAKDWAACRDGLTQARGLDPQGDLDSRVQAAWQATAEANAIPQVVPSTGPDKPPRPQR